MGKQDMEGRRGEEEREEEEKIYGFIYLANLSRKYQMKCNITRELSLSKSYIHSTPKNYQASKANRK